MNSHVYFNNEVFGQIYSENNSYFCKLSKSLLQIYSSFVSPQQYGFFQRKIHKYIYMINKSTSNVILVIVNVLIVFILFYFIYSILFILFFTFRISLPVLFQEKNANQIIDRILNACSFKCQFLSLNSLHKLLFCFRWHWLRLAKKSVPCILKISHKNVRTFLPNINLLFLLVQNKFSIKTK